VTTASHRRACDGKPPRSSWLKRLWTPEPSAHPGAEPTPTSAFGPHIDELDAEAEAPRTAPDIRHLGANPMPVLAVMLTDIGLIARDHMDAPAACRLLDPHMRELHDRAERVERRARRFEGGQDAAERLARSIAGAVAVGVEPDTAQLGAALARVAGNQSDLTEQTLTFEAVRPTATPTVFTAELDSSGILPLHGGRHPASALRAGDYVLMCTPPAAPDWQLAQHVRVDGLEIVASLPGDLLMRFGATDLLWILPEADARGARQARRESEPQARSLRAGDRVRLGDDPAWHAVTRVGADDDAVVAEFDDGESAGFTPDAPVHVERQSEAGPPLTLVPARTTGVPSATSLLPGQGVAS
jgi:hypothetical protein